MTEALLMESLVLLGKWIVVIIMLIIIYSLALLVRNRTQDFIAKYRIKKMIKEEGVRKKFRCCNYCKRKEEKSNYCKKYDTRIKIENVSINNDCASYKGKYYKIIKDYSLDHEFNKIAYNK